MTVIMKGGTTGNREKNAIVAMPGFDSQPVKNTAGGSANPDLQMEGGTTGNRDANSIVPMPLGGTPDDSNT